MIGDPEGVAAAETLISRRRAIGLTMAGIAAAVAGCSSEPTGNSDIRGNPRLTARPHPPIGGIAPGLHALGLSSGRDGLLYIPAGYDAGTPAPFSLMLHGATRAADEGLVPFQHLADETGMILLAPSSRFSTWDVTRGAFGPDVAFIDAALSVAFDQCAIDPARMAIAGFSDGASYALSLGLANGDLFPHVAAFSPGFLALKDPVGKPHVFITHGIQDQVLPIDRTSRRIVPRLRLLGYTVDYREFEGQHVMLVSMTEAAAAQIVD